MSNIKFRDRIEQFSNTFFGRDFLEVLKHSKNYFLGDVFGQGLMFISLMFFTRLLSPADYGTFQVFRSYASIFLLLLPLNFHGAVSRYYYEQKSDFKEFVGTSILGSLFFFTFTSLFLLLFHRQVSNTLGISNGLLNVTLLFVSVRIFDTVFNQISTAAKQSLLYTVVNNARVILGIGLGLGLIYFFNNNKFYGPILGQFFAGIIVSFYTIRLIKSQTLWNIKRDHIKYIFNYSLPLVPYLMSGLLLDQLDRIIINKTLGAVDAGLYSFAYNVGMIVSLATDALSAALVPDWFSLMKEQNYKRIDALVSKVFKVTLFIALGAILFSKEPVEFLSDPQYHVALSILPIVMVGYVFDALSKVYLRSIGYTNKMMYVAFVGVFAVFANFVLNIIYLPRYGYVAGAYVTVFSFILITVLSLLIAKYVLKQHVTSLKNFLKPAFIFVIAMILYYFILKFDLNFIYSFGLRLIVFTLFTVFLFQVNKKQAVDMV